LEEQRLAAASCIELSRLISTVKQPTEISKIALKMSETSIPVADASAPIAAKPKRRFVGSSTRPSRGKAVPARRVNQIPDEILNDKALNEAISGKSFLDSVCLGLC
jgi:hypothetical protein